MALHAATETGSRKGEREMTPATAPPVPRPPLPQRGARYRLVAPNSPTAPGIVRDFLGTLLRATGHPRLVDDARLCASEVVTNSYCHTRSRMIRVDVTVNPKQVTVYVTDEEPDSPPRPVHRQLPDAERGRGLVLVDCLAARWGVRVNDEPVPGSKSVWFTLVE
ncbi:ATP-binding protein [Streptomyces sp. NBC_01014]|uniref:ATP-binding protein n=1 Tax=Streptomyces sp. NBC_01014 TaxID=2903719 RepID=UPI00386D64DE